ncbi:MAG: uroporphyrinogen decarboxylase family protein [Spirochaetota bacterium]
MSESHPEWHIAFCNVTYTEYAGMTYREYYRSPESMLRAQLAAQEHVRRRFGEEAVRSVRIAPDSDGRGGASRFFGMTMRETSEDEIPYLDTSSPVVSSPNDIDGLSPIDIAGSGLFRERRRFWEYYRAHGFDAPFWHSGSVISTAVEISDSAIFTWMAECPSAAHRLLALVTDVMEEASRIGAAIDGSTYTGHGYTGDDFSGLLSPQMYREFAVPYYRRLYAGQKHRFMHSELLRTEHLRIARDEVGITDFHGAGCVNLSLVEMNSIMGRNFWTQLTPQEMNELTPERIDDRIREFAGSGAAHIQLYPGRGTSDRNMDAAMNACVRECSAGMTTTA